MIPLFSTYHQWPSSRTSDSPTFLSSGHTRLSLDPQSIQRLCEEAICCSIRSVLMLLYLIQVAGVSRITTAFTKVIYFRLKHTKQVIWW